LTLTVFRHPWHPLPDRIDFSGESSPILAGYNKKQVNFYRATIDVTFGAATAKMMGRNEKQI
jgi:hypothetical protein